MSMSDDNTLRPYRSSDPYRRAAEPSRSEEHTSELQSLRHLVCRLLLEKKNSELHAHELFELDTALRGGNYAIPEADECHWLDALIFVRVSDDASLTTVWVHVYGVIDL